MDKACSILILLLAFSVVHSAPAEELCLSSLIEITANYKKKIISKLLGIWSSNYG